MKTRKYKCPMFSLLLAFIIASAATSAFAQNAGIFGYGIELLGTGTGALNSGVTTLYALNNGGTTRLLPLGSTATLNQTSWGNGSEASPVLNLGTFVPGAGDTLTLLGGAMLTFQNGGATVGSNIKLNYRVSPSGGPLSSFPSGLLLGLNESNVNGTTGDMRWSDESKSIDLLAGLTPGTYILGSYGLASTSLGTKFANNGGANYGAYFTVEAVPEPSTLAVAGLGGLAMMALIRRRKI